MQQCQIFLSQDLLNNNEIMQKHCIYIPNSSFFLLLDVCLKKFVFSKQTTLGQRRVCVGEKIHLDANLCK